MEGKYGFGHVVSYIFFVHCVIDFPRVLAQKVNKLIKNSLNILDKMHSTINHHSSIEHYRDFNIYYIIALSTVWETYK